jgi:hypothetical protein
MAIIANIFIDQGADFSITVNVADVDGTTLDLAGYTAAAQMRKTYESSSSSAAFTTSISSPTTDGQVTLSLTDTVTNALSPGRYVYDLVVTSGGGLKTRVVEGQAVVTPGVTR